MGLDIQNIKLLNDTPILEGTDVQIDGLGFEHYASVLSNVAVNTIGPFTIGIFGPWGSGKTSLLRIIEKKLTANNDILPVWFNAWRYEADEHPIIPLVATIIRGINKNKTFADSLSEKKNQLFSALRAVAYGFSGKAKIKIPGIADLEAAFLAKDMIERHADLINDPLLDRSIYYSAFDNLSRVNLSGNKKIVVLIDDLDRCFPDKAIKLLESMKLVFCQYGFIFFLSVAREVVEGYLEHHYKNNFGLPAEHSKSYLDKLIQLPFFIPPHRDRMGELWANLISQLDYFDRDRFMQLESIISPACGDNPRSAVRFMNNLIIDQAIFRLATEGEKLSLSMFAVSRSLQQRWPQVFEILCQDDSLCNKISDYCTIEPSGPFETFLLKVIEKEPDLKSLLESPEGKRWLTDHGLRQSLIAFLEKREISQEAVETDESKEIRLSIDGNLITKNKKWEVKLLMILQSNYQPGDQDETPFKLYASLKKEGRIPKGTQCTLEALGVSGYCRAVDDIGSEYYNRLSYLNRETIEEIWRRSLTGK